jgi:hypothetical protein
MITDIYAAPTRKLLQPGDMAQLDAESALALANAGASKAKPLPMKTAKLLISSTQAASIQCPTLAYPAPGATINTTVGVALVSASSAPTTSAAAGAPANATAAAAAAASANALSGSRLSLTFPYFETLYYDPVVSFGSTDGMQMSDAFTSNSGNCTGIVCGRTAAPRSAAAAPRTSGLGRAALALAAAVAVAALA